MELKRIAKAFDILSKAYDLISYTMSFGVTIYWRNRLISKSLEFIDVNTKYILDLCAGTGDIAIGIRKQINNEEVKIVAFDVSFGMLQKLKQKARMYNNIIPIIGDISCMPFKDKSFQLATMSFGARSLLEGEKQFNHYFEEIYRTSDKLINLETSQPNNPIIKFLYYSYLYFIIIILGSLFFPHYNKEYYKTIKNFPSYDQFSEILKKIGYSSVDVIPIFGGMAAIHIAHRL